MASIKYISLIYFLLIPIILFINVDLSQSYCRESRLCCTGRDSSCLIQMSKKNSLSNDIIDNSCYCDHACITLGDCCPDYKESCGVIDCQVTTWGPWSECSVDCGSGTMTRKREKIRESENGGKPCPELEQKRGCHGQKCEPRGTAKVTRESAFLLPSRFLHQREMNSTANILKTVLLQNPKDQETNEEYCIVFNVTKARKGCDHKESTKKLIVGREVCVSCETAAMRKHLGHRCHGHGVDNKHTRWTSLSNSDCHGKWVRLGQYRECPCHSSGAPDYIFV